MQPSAYNIEIIRLLFVAIPLLCVFLIQFFWKINISTLLYATARMVIQLLLVGYALIVIFSKGNIIISSVVLTIMLGAASWIALRPVRKKRKKYFQLVLFSIFTGCVPVLILVTKVVINLNPWYMPRYFIPLASMIFANAMNAMSLCVERFFAEIEAGQPFLVARNRAYQTALIPLTNSFFAVGLVSLPGMMTGQILAGISPLLAVRYQIMVMSMLMGACGISSAVFLALTEKKFKQGEENVKT